METRRPRTTCNRAVGGASGVERAEVKSWRRGLQVLQSEEMLHIYVSQMRNHSHVPPQLSIH